jgi:hypothetical protein
LTFGLHILSDFLFKVANNRRAALIRFGLTDAQWALIEPHCLGKASDPGQTGRNPRLFVEAVP